MILVGKHAAVKPWVGGRSRLDNYADSAIGEEMNEFSVAEEYERPVTITGSSNILASISCLSIGRRAAAKPAARCCIHNNGATKEAAN